MLVFAFLLAHTKRAKLPFYLLYIHGRSFPLKARCSFASLFEGAPNGVVFKGRPRGSRALEIDSGGRDRWEPETEGLDAQPKRKGEGPPAVFRLPEVVFRKRNAGGEAKESKVET